MTLSLYKYIHCGCKWQICESSIEMRVRERENKMRRKGSLIDI